MGTAMSRGELFVLIGVIGCVLVAQNAFGQAKTVVVGEGVRGAMYLPAYIAEENGDFDDAGSGRSPRRFESRTASFRSRAFSSSSRRKSLGS